MITYGFFNSVDGDRTYNADTFNKYFEGLISPNGVFENVRGGFIVSAGPGLSVNVASGKAIVNSRWVDNDTTENIVLDTAHSVLSRYDMISLYWNETNRSIELRKTTGTPASTPSKPTPIRKTNEWEIAIAYVLVKPNATSINIGNISDCRHDTEVCGIITGLINQVDTSVLFTQYITQFNDLLTQMEEWQKQQQNGFDNWMQSLTEELNVNTYIQSYNISYDGDGETYNYKMPSEYASGDIVDVYLNNIVLIPGDDYNIYNSDIELNAPIAIGNKLTIRILKSVIGYQTN